MRLRARLDEEKKTMAKYESEDPGKLQETLAKLKLYWDKKDKYGNKREIEN